MRASKISYPYLRVPGSVITAGAWSVSAGDGDGQPLADQFEGWDYNVDLRLKRTVLIEVEQACNLARLPPETGLKLLVLAGTGLESEKTQKIVHSTGFSMEGDRRQIDIDFTLSGRELSGRLYLRTEIVLARPSPVHQPLGATRRWSRLWSDERVTSLEGEMGRFPMEAHDFSSVHRGRGIDDALWYLEWYPDDLDVQFISGVRLHLNTRQHGFLERVESSDPVTLSELMSAVAFEMISSFVSRVDARSGWDHFEEGSTGHVLRSWIEAALPGQSIPAVAQLLASDPSRVQAALQSTMVMTDE